MDDELRDRVLAAAFGYVARLRGGQRMDPLDRARLAPRGADPDAVAPVIDALFADGALCTLADGGIDVTPAWWDRARDVHRAVFSRSFGAWMVRSDGSAANAAFRAVVNGLPFTVFDMLTPVQLDAVVRALALGPGDRALDLGCGIGRLTEHLARVTGAAFDGIDFAEEAILAARARTSANAGAPSYDVVPFDAFSPPPAHYAAILAVDVWYFVEDLPALVAACARGLRPGGRLVAFWSPKATDDAPLSDLDADATPAARALTGAGLPYTVEDYTDEELAYWRRSQQAVDRMEAVFAAEGTRDLWESRRDETTRMLDRSERGRSRRWMYVATKP